MNDDDVGRKPVRGLVGAVLALAVGFGAGWYAGPGPARRYCKECAEILALQAKPDRDGGARNEIDRLRMNLETSQRDGASFRNLSGQPPDLHPDCECPCHRYWAGEASRVHGA